MKCPECKRRDHIVPMTIPMIKKNGRKGKKPAYLCEKCSMIFLVEAEL